MQNGNWIDPTGLAQEQAGLPALLRSGYVELMEVDDALRRAEQQLASRHCAGRPQTPGRAEELYREILTLRDRSRRVLGELGEIWARGS